MVFDNLPVGDERLGDPDGHLGIVGVPDLFLGISDQLLDRRETSTNRVGGLGLEFTPERSPRWPGRGGSPRIDPSAWDQRSPYNVTRD